MIFPLFKRFSLPFFTRKRTKRFFIGTCLFLAVAAIALLTTVDRTPYRETEYYREFRRKIVSLPKPKPATGADTLQVGWAKVNITPPHPMPTAGYGQRLGKRYTAVHDSIYVRAFVFDNGLQKAALVSADLLIIAPELTNAIARRLPAIGFSIEQTYLCATHSHNSTGGWAGKLVGSLIAGGHEPEMIDFLADGFAEAIRQADLNKATAAIGAVAYPARELVENRLEITHPTDSLLRVLKIRKTSGETAVVATFTAHPTLISDEEIVLSRDYPGVLVDALERSGKIDFAAFCAGAVGSHTTRTFGRNSWEAMDNEAGFLAKKIVIGFDKIPLGYHTQLRTVSVPLPLRQPHFRISGNIRLRPWVFHAAYGDYPSVIKGLRIGNTVWIGMPADFSGELVPAIQPYGNWPRNPLFVTSFNGGYIGYVTPDAYYDRPYAETREMNWFGPYNGAYLTEAARETMRYLNW